MTFINFHSKMNSQYRALLFFIGVFLPAAVLSQTTAIPDTNFEQFLVDQGIDTNGLNGNILDADAAAVTVLDVTVNSIIDFSGLEAFVNLVTLDAGTNQFPTLPLTTLTALESLTLEENVVLASLDFSQNLALKFVRLRANGGANAAPITIIDLSANTLLESINIYNFKLLEEVVFPDTDTVVDLYLLMFNDIIVDFSGYDNLEILTLSTNFNNTIPIIATLPSNQNTLRRVSFQGGNLINVDISNFLALEFLSLQTTNTQNIDLPVTPTLTDIRISSHNIDDISFANASGLTDLSIVNKMALPPLQLDITQNVFLEDLSARNNFMNTIDLSQNVILDRLNLSQNELTDVDLSTNTLLTNVDISENELVTLDTETNILLENLNLDENEITSLDLSTNVVLEDLFLNENLLPTIDLSENVLLEQLEISFNQLTSLDVSFNDQLEDLVAHDNLITGNAVFTDYHQNFIDSGRMLARRYKLIVFNNMLTGPVANFGALVSDNGVSTDTQGFEFEFYNNAFHFGDFENEHSDYVQYFNTISAYEFANSNFFSAYEYAGQAKVDEIETLNQNAGDDVTLTCEVRGAQNHYKWFKDGAEIPNAPDSPELILNDLNSCDQGVYHTEITSDLVPFENGDGPGANGKNLLLIRNDITLNVEFTSSCVVLENPTDGATDVPVNTGITWTNSPGACRYILSVGTTPLGTDIVNDLNVGDVQTYNFAANLPPGEEIFVTVVAVFRDGPQSTCEAGSFTTGSITGPAGCISLTYPFDGATDVQPDADFSWEPSNGADGYFLNVGTTAGGTDIFDMEDVGNVTFYDLPADLPEGATIYVTLIPYNDFGNTNACTEISFTTKSVLSIPECVTLADPLDGETGVSLETDISWTSSPNADGYIISIGTTSGDTDIVNNEEVGNVTNYVPINDLPPNSEIFVTITPYNAAGSASNCLEQSFFTQEVAPPCTFIDNPDDGLINVPVTTNINWDDIATADGYILIVGTTSGGTDIVDNLDVGNVFTYDFPVDLPQGTEIFVTVIPYNAAGNASGCEEESFTTEFLIPECTTLLDPVNGAIDVLLTTDIFWNPSDLADGYILTVGTTSGGTDIIDNQGVGNVTTFDLPADLPEFTEIFVTITPYNAIGNATGCAEESFTTQLFIPDCVALTDPLNGATDVLVETDLNWAAASTASGYILNVGTTSGGTDILNNQDVGNVTTFDLPADLPESTEIFVTVIPYNATGNATGCVEESFTTELLLPDCVTLTDPINGAADVLIGTDLSWSTADTADGYFLTVGTTSGGTDIINNQDVGNVTTFDLPADLPEFTEIFVTVIPYNATGNTTVCAEESFTTQLFIPECVTLTNPLNGATDVLVGTDLSWTAASTASGYILNVGTTSGGTDILNNQDVGNVTNFDLPADLLEFTEIFVMVTPYNTTGNATGCAEESFTTQLFVPDCVTLTDPLNGATDVLVGTDLSWTAAPTASGYFLTLGTSPGGTDILNSQDVGNVTTFDLPADLPEFTEIFVMIIPYNDTGEATGCTEESFTTQLFVPDCVTLTDPLNGSTDVVIGTDLTWTAASTASGYFLTVGTTPGGTDIINNQDVGNVTTFDLPADLPEFTEIFVMIIPYNDTGEAASCAEESFTTQLFVPNCVMLADPLNGATDVLIGTDLTWTAASTASGYFLTVGTTPGGTDIINNQDVGNVTTFDLPADLPEFTEIFVTITPYNDTGEATSCVEESFTTQLFVPDCVSLLDPLNGADAVLIGTDLSWTQAGTAAGYILTVGTTSGGVDIINNQDVGNVTTFDLPIDLPEASEIFVTILPYNATGTAISCAEESFTTQTFPPSCTALINPLNGAQEVSIVTALTWDAVANATGYLLTVETAIGAGDIINNQDVGNVTTFNLASELPQETEIFVTVIPYNIGGEASGCATVSFNTELLPPDCTSLLEPSDGSTNVSINAGLSWNAVDNADGYFVSAGTFPGGEDIIDFIDVQNVTELSLAEDWPEGATIYVTITPYNVAGLAQDCEEQSFTIEDNSVEEDNDQKFGFSPDGDGVNEYWEIKGIQNYPDNVVSIYNRWGELVFEISGYDNGANAFRGSANKATGRGAGELPEGTYFFTIQTALENNLPNRGYLVLKR